MKTIGYTERTLGLDAVIRHQEIIIQELKELLENDPNGVYYTRPSWLGRKLFGEHRLLTTTGREMVGRITGFEKGLRDLQQQMAALVREDIDSQTEN